MDRNIPNTDIETHKIERWFFVPYKNIERYRDDDPLYSIIAEYRGLGDVMVYNRSSRGGIYHSVDPSHEAGEYYPPTDAFEQILCLVFTREGEEHDVSDLLEEVHPWEHHQLESLVAFMNQRPDDVPAEMKSLIKTAVDRQQGYHLEEFDTTDVEDLPFF